MHSIAQTAAISKSKLWVGRILSAVPVLMLLFSGIGKLMKAPQVVQGMGRFGYPENLLLAIGITEIACTVVYLIPRSSVLGAIFLAAYLGGATATMVRIGDPLFFMPALLGVLAWAGLFLRDARLRALIPVRT